jgi:hypothetical protein
MPPQAVGPNRAPLAVGFNGDGEQTWLLIGSSSSPDSFGNSVISLSDGSVLLAGSFIGRLSLGGISVGLEGKGGGGFSPIHAFVAHVGANGLVSRIVYNMAEIKSSVDNLASNGQVVVAVGSLWGWADFAGERIGAARGSNAFVSMLNLDL